MSLWGSLQKGVASLESRLDTILGETEDVPQQPKPEVATRAPASPALEAVDNQAHTRKQSTSTSTNDRLQARLARAIAAKNHASSTSNSSSRVGKPDTIHDTRRSIDAISIESQDSTAERPRTPVLSAGKDVSLPQSPTTATKPATPSRFVAAKMPQLEHTASPRSSMEGTAANVDEPTTESSPRLVMEKTGPVETIPLSGLVTADDVYPSAQPPNSAIRSAQTSVELERSDQERQEEIHEYIERIDALQAKLQYLSKEAVISARAASAAAASGSIEKKMAQKDEQIALLMEEGQKLSKAEMKYMAIIKTLRAKSAEHEKEASDTKAKADKFAKERSTFTERFKRTDAIEKQLSEMGKRLAQTHKELSTVIAEKDAKDEMIASLRNQLQDVESQAKAEQVKVVTAELEEERKRVSGLESELSSLKTEKDLAAGRAAVQLEELRSKGEREAERSRVTELEMKAEQQLLESRLEVLRTRAEEVSSGATGDAQAKLLRQIETLQTQYSTASENWQRIETLITSRATNLEKERNEALKREADTRRKARELNMKTKHIEDEAEASRASIAELQRRISEQEEALEKLQRRSIDAETALEEARSGYELEKQSWSDMLPRTDERTSKSRQESYGYGPGYGSASRAESPVATTHRSLTAEYLSLQNLQTRRSSARSTSNDMPPSSRKTSSHLLKSASGRVTPVRNNSHQSIFLTSDAPHAPPSIVAMDQDDDFENVVTPTSPHDKMNDLISVSTVGAGPTVQLVERMSAAVRRLENEKVSTKEELARLSAQRDEARAEIVTLMTELEEKKTIERRVQELEDDNEKIMQRYQTTLEMLGEKSELVEELRADVQDVKGMYRELVERTVK